MDTSGTDVVSVEPFRMEKGKIVAVKITGAGMNIPGIPGLAQEEVVDITPTPYKDLAGVVDVIQRRYSIRIRYVAAYTEAQKLGEQLGDAENRFKELLSHGNNSSERIIAPAEPQQGATLDSAETAQKEFEKAAATEQEKPVSQQEDKTTSPRIDELRKELNIPPVAEKLEEDVEALLKHPAPKPQPVPKTEQSAQPDAQPAVQEQVKAQAQEPMTLQEQAKAIFPQVIEEIKKKKNKEFTETDLIVYATKYGVSANDVDAVVKEILKLLADKAEEKKEPKKDKKKSPLANILNRKKKE